LCRAYGVAATNPDGPGYESVLSMLTRAVMGHGASTTSHRLGAAVLALSANTAFADFPRLTRAIALDDYMPHVFLLRAAACSTRGHLCSGGLTAILLIVFGGVTDRLIPLFAIGAFLAFTLSQAGMVMHWKRQGKARLKMLSTAWARCTASPPLWCWWPSLPMALDHRAAGCVDDRAHALSQESLLGVDRETALDRPSRLRRSPSPS